MMNWQQRPRRWGPMWMRLRQARDQQELWECLGAKSLFGWFLASKKQHEVPSDAVWVVEIRSVVLGFTDSAGNQVGTKIHDPSDCHGYSLYDNRNKSIHARVDI